MELFVPSGKSVRSPAIKISLSVRLRLGGASPISLEDANDSISKTTLFFEYQSKGKC
jgi:hypothetical protein